MQLAGQRVDADGVGDDVQRLAVVADAVGSPAPECVVEVAVDGLSVASSG